MRALLHRQLLIARNVAEVGTPSAYISRGFGNARNRGSIIAQNLAVNFGQAGGDIIGSSRSIIGSSGKVGAELGRTAVSTIKRQATLPLTKASHSMSLAVSAPSAYATDEHRTSHWIRPRTLIPAFLRRTKQVQKVRRESMHLRGEATSPPMAPSASAPSSGSPTAAGPSPTAAAPSSTAAGPSPTAAGPSPTAAAPSPTAAAPSPPRSVSFESGASGESLPPVVETDETAPSAVRVLNE